MESSKTLLEKALRLKPHEKIQFLECLIQSLDEPDKDIDSIWAEEAEKRLEAYRSGKIKGVPFEEIFGVSEALDMIVRHKGVKTAILPWK